MVLIAMLLHGQTISSPLQHTLCAFFSLTILQKSVSLPYQKELSSSYNFTSWKLSIIPNIDKLGKSYVTHRNIESQLLVYNNLDFCPILNQYFASPKWYAHPHNFCIISSFNSLYQVIYTNYANFYKLILQEWTISQFTALWNSASTNWRTSQYLKNWNLI